MTNVVLITNITKDKNLATTKKVIEKLNCLGLNTYIADTYREQLNGASFYKDFPENAELLIVIGGDGSVIDASEYAIMRDIPIVGVNLGRIGYLAEIEADDLDALDGIVSGEYDTVEKMLLRVTVNGKEANNERYAVNDIVISHNGYLGIADVKVEDHCGNVLKYRADGVVIATPQGSTAYSLSAGGPIVAHDVESMLLTPVAPHSFFNRSVIFNSSEEIKITNLGDGPMNISVDGRPRASIDKYEYCVVSCPSKRIKMLTFEKNVMFSKLFKKMRILEDMHDEKCKTD